MGYLGRRIGKNQNTGTAAAGEDGNLGGGILDLFEQGYFVRDGKIDRTISTSQGLTASGGVVSDYNTPPGAVYRAHVFTSTGTFAVSAIGAFGSTVDVLAVAGGGGGGGGTYHGAGGGAGGYLEGPITIPAVPTSYTVTIGGGGRGGFGGNDGVAGSNTTLLDPRGGPYTYTATGGGKGAHSPGGNGGNSGGAGGVEVEYQ